MIVRRKKSSHCRYYIKADTAVLFLNYAERQLINLQEALREKQRITKDPDIDKEIMRIKKMIQKLKVVYSDKISLDTCCDIYEEARTYWRSKNEKSSRNEKSKYLYRLYWRGFS